MGGSSSYEVEDEFHRAEEDRGEPPGDGDGDRDGDVPLELTKKSEEEPPPAPVPAEDSQDSLHDAVSSSEPAQEVEVKTEEEARPSEAALHLNGAAHQAGAGPGEAAEAGVAGAEVAGVLQQQQQEYGGQLGQLVYHNDGSYIEYSYEDGTKAAGEASVQVVKLSAIFRDNFRNIWTRS